MNTGHALTLSGWTINTLAHLQTESKLTPDFCGLDRLGIKHYFFTVHSGTHSVASSICLSSSSNASPSEGAPLQLASYGCTPQSLPKFCHPSHELLQENGFTQQVYHKYRRRCLNGTHISSNVIFNPFFCTMAEYCMFNNWFHL